MNGLAIAAATRVILSMHGLEYHDGVQWIRECVGCMSLHTG